MNKSLFSKALLYREWKQQQFVLILLALSLLFQPVLGSIMGAVIQAANSNFTNISQSSSMQEHLVILNTMQGWAYTLLTLTNTTPIFAIPFLGAALCALVTVQTERREHNLETVLMTPLSVADVIRTKWSMAFSVIAVCAFVGTLTLWTESAKITPMINTAGAALLFFILLIGLACIGYAVTFVVSLVIGDFIAATVTTGIVFSLPYLILATVNDVMANGGGSFGASSVIRLMGEIQTIANFSWIGYYLNPNSYLNSLLPNYILVIVAAVCIVASSLLLWAAVAIAGRIPLEHFRQIFLSRWLRSIALWFVVAAGSVLFGLFYTSLVAQHSISYGQTNSPHPVEFATQTLTMSGVVWTFCLSAVLCVVVITGCLQLFKRFRSASARHALREKSQQ